MQTHIKEYIKKVLFISTYASIVDEKTWQEVKKSFEDPATAKDEDLVMVNFSVTPIWEIITGLNPAKANAVEDYIRNTYLK